MAGALEGDVFIGRRAQEFRGLLKIKYPMEHGIVTDWDDMQRIWSWVYAEELGTLSEEVSTLNPRLKRLNKRDFQQHPVLLTEAPLNPRSNRDVAAQIFFDTFNVPALFTSVQAVLSLYVMSPLCSTKTRSMCVFFGSDIRPGGQQGSYLIRGMASLMQFPYLRDSRCLMRFGELTSREGINYSFNVRIFSEIRTLEM